MSNDNDKGFLSQEEIDALLNGGESKGEDIVDRKSVV